jgi:hypothetical protein
MTTMLRPECRNALAMHKCRWVTFMVSAPLAQQSRGVPSPSPPLVRLSSRDGHVGAWPRLVFAGAQLHGTQHSHKASDNGTGGKAVTAASAAVSSSSSSSLSSSSSSSSSTTSNKTNAPDPKSTAVITPTTDAGVVKQDPQRSYTLFPTLDLYSATHYAYMEFDPSALRSMLLDVTSPSQAVLRLHVDWAQWRGSSVCAEHVQLPSDARIDGAFFSYDDTKGVEVVADLGCSDAYTGHYIEFAVTHALRRYALSSGPGHTFQLRLSSETSTWVKLAAAENPEVARRPVLRIVEEGWAREVVSSVTRIANVFVYLFFSPLHSMIVGMLLATAVHYVRKWLRILSKSPFVEIAEDGVCFALEHTLTLLNAHRSDRKGFASSKGGVGVGVPAAAPSTPFAAPPVQAATPLPPLPPPVALSVSVSSVDDEADGAASDETVSSSDDDASTSSSSSSSQRTTFAPSSSRRSFVRASTRPASMLQIPSMSHSMSTASLSSSDSCDSLTSSAPSRSPSTSPPLTPRATRHPPFAGVVGVDALPPYRQRQLLLSATAPSDDCNEENEGDNYGDAATRPHHTVPIFHMSVWLQWLDWLRTRRDERARARSRQTRARSLRRKTVNAAAAAATVAAGGAAAVDGRRQAQQSSPQRKKGERRRAAGAGSDAGSLHSRSPVLSSSDSDSSLSLSPRPKNVRRAPVLV